MKKKTTYSGCQITSPSPTLTFEGLESCQLRLGTYYLVSLKYSLKSLGSFLIVKVIKKQMVWSKYFFNPK